MTEDKVPKKVNIDNRIYKFIKKCNDNTYLYQDVRYGWNRCFGKHELGLVKETSSAILKPAHHKKR